MEQRETLGATPMGRIRAITEGKGRNRIRMWGRWRGPSPISRSKDGEGWKTTPWDTQGGSERKMKRTGVFDLGAKKAKEDGQARQEGTVEKSRVRNERSPPANIPDTIARQCQRDPFDTLANKEHTCLESQRWECINKRIRDMLSACLSDASSMATQPKSAPGTPRMETRKDPLSSIPEMGARCQVHRHRSNPEAVARNGSKQSSKLCCTCRCGNRTRMDRNYLRIDLPFLLCSSLSIEAPALFLLLPCLLQAFGPLYPQRCRDLIVKVKVVGQQSPVIEGVQQ